MRAVPQPSENAIPVNEPETVRLEPGQRATFTFTPSQRKTPGFVLPTLLGSKHPETVYKVWLDGSLKFGPAAVPPADVDRGGVTFAPAYEFSEELRVQVTNTSEASTRNVTVQPIGWEKSGADHGA